MESQRLAFNTESDAPFVLPVVFVVVFGLLLGGILLNRRGRGWAAYWLGTSIFLIGILAFVHFVGSATAETPSVIRQEPPTHRPSGSCPDRPLRSLRGAGRPGGPSGHDTATLCPLVIPKAVEEKAHMSEITTSWLPTRLRPC